MVSVPFGQTSRIDAAGRGRSPTRGGASFRIQLTFAATAAALGLACASAGGASAPPPRSAGSAAIDERPEEHVDVERTLHAAALDERQFVRAVLARNPSLEAARHGVRAAAARVRQAGTFEDPMVDFAIAPLSIGSSEAPFGYEVGISQKLPWFGKRSLETQASEAEVAAVKSDYEAMKRELGLSAVMLYAEYFAIERSLELNREHVALMHSMHDSAVARFGSGHGSAQDALQAESELTHLEHDAVMLATRRDVTVARMNELLHRDPELALPPPPRELPPPPEFDRSRDGAKSAATRPEIEAVEARARAAEARAERADREGYPDVTLSASYNSMWAMPEHRLMVGAALSVPIQPGRRQGMADEARAMRAELESERTRMTDEFRTRAFVAGRELEESRHVLGLFEKRLLPVARAQIDAARTAFTTSDMPFSGVIEAERNLRAVELDYQLQRAEALKRGAELERALGLIPGVGAKKEQP